MTAFFGDLAPITVAVAWDGEVREVTFRLLDAAAERRLASEVARFPLEQRIVAERERRMAHAVLAVGENTVEFQAEDDEAEMRARYEWAATIPGPLLIALSEGYEQAAQLPLTLVGQMERDPNTATGHGQPGT